MRRERELHDQIAAERAQARYHKHFLFCREALEQVVDLATKAGEYRLLSGRYALCRGSLPIPAWPQS